MAGIKFFRFKLQKQILIKNFQSVSVDMPLHYMHVQGVIIHFLQSLETEIKLRWRVSLVPLYQNSH